MCPLSTALPAAGNKETEGCSSRGKVCSEFLEALTWHADESLGLTYQDGQGNTRQVGVTQG